MLNDTTKEQKAIDCAVQHIKTFRGQALEEKKADFGAPCEECKYVKECNLEWCSIIEPLIEKSTIKIHLQI